MTTTPASPSMRLRPEKPARIESALKVLVADTLEKVGMDGLEKLGCEVKHDPDLTPETLPGALGACDPDVLIVRSTVVPAEVFEKAKRLSLVLRAGAGYDTIDVAAASAKGIYVANCPGKNSIAVAELVWALILCCDRRVPDQTADLRARKWDKKEYSKAAGLYGRTLGIVGLGQIGKEVALRGLAFGMKVVAWSRSLTEKKADELGVGYCSNIINLAKMSDVISVNVAATQETRHLIDRTFCQAMKPGAYLINTSRGSVVDQAALIDVIRTKGVRAGLDVYAREPHAGDQTFADEIVREPCVYGTHHIGASTDQAQHAVAREAVRVMKEYLRTGKVLNCVNRAASTPATTILTVRHLNTPGVLAHIFYTLGQAGINVEEMENVIYEGAQAACVRIQLDHTPGKEHLTAIGANENVLSVNVAKIRST